MIPSDTRPAPRAASPLAGFDRLLEHAPGAGATAVRNIPNTLQVFTTHFPRKPVLPGVLALESLAALAAVVCDPDAPERWTTSGASGVRFRHFVTAGDELELRVRLVERAGGTARFTAEARVGDRVVVGVRTLALTVVEET
ncbi:MULTISPECIES: hydroxymyristoyl-ACP dehydratase [unclassified Streptomyces]|uniref:hydroxymyristoyl-ACP dehydratase n=1 Tax=unclassified Streptomyces TaxID=2593676 RepID=UPI00331E7056